MTQNRACTRNSCGYHISCLLVDATVEKVIVDFNGECCLEINEITKQNTTQSNIHI